MANTRLFDSWQIGMDLPAPFDRAIDGGVRYSTKEEDCSCYNKAIRGKSNTLSRRAPCGAEPDAGRTGRWKHRCVLLYGVHESISGKSSFCETKEAAEASKTEKRNKR